MPSLHSTIPTPGGLVRIVSTGCDDGDFALDSVVPERRAAIHPGRWTHLRQVHGADLVEVATPGEGAGRVADAVLTAATDAPIAVVTADCAPVVLVGDGAVAVVHAGWRGLVAGVIEVAAHRLASMGVAPISSVLGPCIHPGRYEFSDADLATVAERYGEGVRSRTEWGTPALDLPASVGLALRGAGWPTPGPSPCTSEPAFFSHRTRGDTGRQTTVAWIER